MSRRNRWKRRTPRPKLNPVVTPTPTEQEPLPTRSLRGGWISEYQARKTV